jgi:succinate dehydrogenase flavin-adding protein (antitoxin of CptAB toxin-antitoxin module)
VETAGSTTGPVVPVLAPGTQESDLILGRFADLHLPEFDSAQLDRFEALLDCTDPDLFDWIIGGFAPPKEHDHDVMRLCEASLDTTTGKTHNWEPSR